MSTVGPLHVPVEPGGTGRQQGEADATAPALLLALGPELRATVHLDGLDGEGTALLQLVQIRGGAVRGGLAEDGEDAPTAGLHRSL